MPLLRFPSLLPSSTTPRLVWSEAFLPFFFFFLFSSFTDQTPPPLFSRFFFFSSFQLPRCSLFVSRTTDLPPVQQPDGVTPSFSYLSYLTRAYLTTYSLLPRALASSRTLLDLPRRRSTFRQRRQRLAETTRGYTGARNEDYGSFLCEGKVVGG